MKTRMDPRAALYNIYKEYRDRFQLDPNHVRFIHVDSWPIDPAIFADLVEEITRENVEIVPAVPCIDCPAEETRNVLEYEACHVNHDYYLCKALRELGLPEPSLFDPWYDDLARLYGAYRGYHYVIYVGSGDGRWDKLILADDDATVDLIGRMAEAIKEYGVVSGMSLEVLSPEEQKRRLKELIGL